MKSVIVLTIGGNDIKILILPTVSVCAIIVNQPIVADRCSTIRCCWERNVHVSLALERLTKKYI